MSEKKKQHFVPRFYLKNFSFQNDGKSIGIWTINTKRYIQRGNLKNQSYGDYFYGKNPAIENAFSGLESEVAKIFSDIIRQHKIPKTETREFFYLLSFVISLSLRSKYTAEFINESADQLIKMAYKEDSRINKYFDEFKIVSKDAPIIALHSLEKCLFISLDLNYKLLVNNTSHMLITSDNPVVKHNQYFKFDTFRSHVGFASKGLQLLLTLSPYTCLIFYDTDVYRVGNRKDSVVNISDPNDIDEINRFQFINADKVLYFNHDINRSYIYSITKESERYLRKSKSVTHEYEAASLEPNTKRSIIHTHPYITHKDLTLSFVRILKKAKRHYTEGKPDLFRDSRLINDLLDREESKHMKFPM